MTVSKERVPGAETDFCNHFLNDIEDVEPDEWDLQMLAEIESNPDCKEFVPKEEILKIL